MLLIFISCGNNTNDKSIKRTTATMGTIIEIQVRDFDIDSADKLITVAFDEIRRINDKYSIYLDSNTIWTINNSKDSLQVDEETWMLLNKCDDYYNITNGRFDAAVDNIVKKLGFEGGEMNLPDNEHILELLTHTGWKHITLKDNRTILRNNDVRINFSAIAKGYAVDRASQILKQGGIGIYLVNAGGEISAEGRNWEIGVQNPRRKNDYLYSIALNSKSVATSGDYEQYFKNKGKRYSHIIDPVTGYPADKSISVTVISDHCIDADALATGMFVLGPINGIKLIETLPNIEGLMIDSTGKEYKSSGFDKFILR
jgi:thiamine biosynthesis lipoprotein